MKIIWNFWGNSFIFIISHLYCWWWYLLKILQDNFLRLIIGSYFWQLGDEGSKKTYKVKSHLHFAHTLAFLRSLFESCKKSMLYLKTTSLSITKRTLNIYDNRHIMSRLSNWWCNMIEGGKVLMCCSNCSATICTTRDSIFFLVASVFLSLSF